MHDTVIFYWENSGFFLKESCWNSKFKLGNVWIGCNRLLEFLLSFYSVLLARIYELLVKNVLRHTVKSCCKHIYFEYIFTVDRCFVRCNSRRSHTRLMFWWAIVRIKWSTRKIFVPLNYAPFHHQFQDACDKESNTSASNLRQIDFPRPLL